MGFEQELRKVVERAAALQSQTALHLQTGVSRDSISNFINGRRQSFRFANVDKLLDAIGARIEIVPGRAEPSERGEILSNLLHEAIHEGMTLRMIAEQTGVEGVTAEYLALAMSNRCDEDRVLPAVVVGRIAFAIRNLRKKRTKRSRPGGDRKKAKAKTRVAAKAPTRRAAGCNRRKGQ